MLAIVREAREEPETIKAAPHGPPVGRLEGVRAVRQPVVRYRFEEHAQEAPRADEPQHLEAQAGA